MFSQDIQPCKHQWKCQCHTAAQPGSEQFEMNKGGWTCAGPTHQLINAAVESSRPDGFCFDARERLKELAATVKTLVGVDFQCLDNVGRLWLVVGGETRVDPLVSEVSVST